MADDVRDNHPGTIENSRKMLAYLKTIDGPSDAAVGLIRRYEAEVAAYDYEANMRAVADHELHRWEDEGGPLHPGSFHDAAGANV